MSTLHPGPWFCRATLFLTGALLVLFLAGIAHAFGGTP